MREKLLFGVFFLLFSGILLKREEGEKNMVKELPKDFLNIGQLKTYQEEIWNMYKYLDDIVNELTPDTSAKSFENFDKIFNIRTKDVEFNDFRDLYFSLQDIHNKISVLIAFLDKQKTE